MKKHFLEGVNVEEGFVGLYGKDKTTLCMSGGYKGCAMFRRASLFERGQ
jgi:hypothetical protein